MDSQNVFSSRPAQISRAPGEAPRPVHMPRTMNNNDNNNNNNDNHDNHTNTDGLVINNMNNNDNNNDKNPQTKNLRARISGRCPVDLGIPAS